MARASKKIASIEQTGLNEKGKLIYGAICTSQPDDGRHDGGAPAPIRAACIILGKPLPDDALATEPPSTYLGENAFPGDLSGIRSLVGDAFNRYGDEELRKMFQLFSRKVKQVSSVPHNATNLAVYFTDWACFARDRGFTQDCYFEYELYRREPFERDKFINEGYRVRVHRTCAASDRTFLRILENKATFNERFSKWVRRPWVNATTCTKEEFEAFVNGTPTFFAKPYKGTGGAGVHILNKDDMPFDELFAFCKSKELICEAIIVQHPDLAAFNASTVNSARVHTLLCADGVVRPTLAIGRFGRSGGAVDNFHNGGVAVCLDVETGKVISRAMNQAHEFYEAHPDSGLTFEGFVYPEWDKVRAAVIEAAKLLPEMRNIGWDVAVTDEGEVEFIEGNGRPNYGATQATDQTGRRHILEQYIPAIEKQEGVSFNHAAPLTFDEKGNFTGSFPANKPTKSAPASSRTSSASRKSTASGRKSTASSSRAGGDVESLRAEVDELNRELERIKSSKSWKLVGVLRKSKKLLVAGKDKLPIPARGKVGVKPVFGKKAAAAAAAKAPKASKAPKKASGSKGSADARRSGAIVEIPYGTKISHITREGIEFYWKPLEGVSGYHVYRSYSRTGKGEKIATVEKAIRHEYCDADFDHSKKRVFYSVCAFKRLEDGTESCSERTKPKEASYRTELALERDATHLYSGDTRQMRALYGWGEPEDAVWSSSNPEVALVDQQGNVTGVSAGECTISCESAKLGQHAQMTAHVDRTDLVEPRECQVRYAFEGEGRIKRVVTADSGASQEGEAVIMMVGDLMCGKKMMVDQATGDGRWCFDDTFESVRPTLAESDFAIANLETLLAPGWPYMLDEVYVNNKNNCNATPQYLNALRYAGFDALAAANNHNCDGGVKALRETIANLDRYAYPYTGIFGEGKEKRFLIAEVNGINVAFLSYNSGSLGFNGKDASWTNDEKEALLNIYTPEKAAADIAACKREGAEYVIVYMHWGFKNHRKLAKHQLAEAREVANAGADFIVGSNPHIVQKYDVVESADGRRVPCYYSLGNFNAVMNQIPGNRESVIVRIKLKRDGESGGIVLAENGYIPCNTYDSVKGMHWPTIVLSDGNPDISATMKLDAHRRSIVKAIGDAAVCALSPMASGPKPAATAARTLDEGVDPNGLSRYEVKPPDFDFVKRPGEPRYRMSSKDLRYKLVDGVWKGTSSRAKNAEDATARLMFVGDLPCFGRQISQAKTQDGYDFAYEFEKVAPLFKQADFVAGNLETTVCREAPYKSERYMVEQAYYCNAPLEFLFALRAAGFDMLTTANNHDMDSGAIGVGATIDNAESLGFIQTGTFKDSRRRFEIVEVNGFRIAVLAYSVFHNGKDVNLTPEGSRLMLNTYTDARARTDIAAAREAGAELVFVCMHWGIELKTKNSAAQLRIANELASMGCDCIIGSHPHVLQPFDYVTYGEKKVPVFYSLGNFVSHFASGDRSRAAIACIEVKRENGVPSLECSYIPVFTSALFGKRKYVVLPLTSSPSQGPSQVNLEKIVTILGEKAVHEPSYAYTESLEDLSGVPAADPSKKKGPKLKGVFDDATFTFKVFSDHATVTGLSEFFASPDCTIPSSVMGVPVTRISRGGLMSERVRRIKFAGQVKKVPTRACKGNVKLEGVQFNAAVEEIGDEAFAGCEMLTGVVLKKGLRKVGSRAFADCFDIRSAKISSSIEEIADDAFAGCPKLTVYCEEGSEAQNFAERCGIPYVLMSLSGGAGMNDGASE